MIPPRRVFVLCLPAAAVLLFHAGCGQGAPTGADDRGPDPGADGAADSGSPEGSAEGSGADSGMDAGADAGGMDAGDAAPVVDDGGAAVITRTGAAGALLLQGMVVTPDVAFAGEVLVEGNTITCVAASCSSQSGAATASVVKTNGIIFPGLVDTHNHILFDTFDQTDWSPSKTYTNHNQWTSDPKYGALVDAKQWLNGETSGSPVSLGCEMDKYGEIKGLIAGTTSIVGAANPADKACYGSLTRTVDQSPNGLASDEVQVATLFPSTASADDVCKNFASGSTDAYVIHVGEGVDATALGEFAKLTSVTTTAGCLDAPQTTIVHGTAFGDPELTTMAASGMSLVWSPRSNVFLYGAGTDLTKTANVPLARSKGINVALAPDWSIGGSQNLLDELRFANEVDDGVWGNVLSSKDLVEMVTKNAAKVLKLDGAIGSLAVGLRADVIVIGGDVTAPYDALLAATPADVRLVLVDGVALYGDAQLESLGPSSPGCEPFGACGASKFLCVARSGGTSTDKLGQTLGDIESSITTALATYDGMDVSAWDFSPITPLVTCSP
ncbi:MAG TPA: amidohydrolase family protein [Polyangiaceae bacterium]|jgi:cytosine/adenosine deaminase-related metal-dependent hydrolase|nr:amidohydrolase family protein [Polyangiaceae bacterium]